MKLEDVKIGMEVVPHQNTANIKGGYLGWDFFIKESGYELGSPCWVDYISGGFVWLRTKEKSAAAWIFKVEDFTLYEETIGKDPIWWANEFEGWYPEGANNRIVKTSLEVNEKGNYMSSTESPEEFKTRCLKAAAAEPVSPANPSKEMPVGTHPVVGPINSTVQLSKYFQPIWMDELEKLSSTMGISKEISESTLAEIQASFDETKAKLADRFNDGKLQWHLVDFKALEPMVQVLMKGAMKYAPFNWQRGLHYSGIFDSLQRHLVAFMSGEDLDPETGLSHVGHAMCNLMFLSWMQQNKTEMDDRIK